ncbi:hypothetical protein BIY27_14985 [Gibbsiella quercinecans]|uniref:DUF6911 family protein n=1 Tax=Gibbsiella quercinecans TaxID=929813 RepID=UPI000EF28990|nr:hypothetical protein [Gibbsiella quercinecans]RLM10082.1 hypothetical protein BIY27_14985 [Gibbsiella quercinecans]
MNVFLKWTLNSQGGKKNSPTWEEVKEYLSKLKDKAGTLTLNNLDGGNIGPDMLQVRAENGNYMLTLGEETDDDYKVRFYWDPSLPNEKLLLLGDYWSERQLIKDFDIVVRVFKEFFDTGNVSADILN